MSFALRRSVGVGAPRAASSPRTLTVMRFTVTMESPSGTQKTLEVPGDKSILQAAEEAGLEVTYLCRSGTCTTCCGKIESGTANQSDNFGLDQDQVKRGFALLCSTYPTSDLVILTDQEQNLH